MERPTYFGAIAAAWAAGLRPVPVPTDAEGGPARPELLDKAIDCSGARLFFCQPLFSNPTGSVLPLERRAAVAAIAIRHHALIIEDDWRGISPSSATRRHRWPRATGRSTSSTCDRSLIGGAQPAKRGSVCRGPAGDRLRAARRVDDFCVPGLLQETALQLVTSPAWPRHLRALRASLRRNRDMLATALQGQLGSQVSFVTPAGRLHLWLRLAERRSDIAVATLAQAAELLVLPGLHAFPAEPPGSFLRLTTR